jgi:hypothetical protein
MPPGKVVNSKNNHLSSSMKTFYVFLVKSKTIHLLSSIKDEWFQNKKNSSKDKDEVG